MTHWLRNREKQVRELQDYATALEKREAYLINRLQKLPRVTGPPEFFPATRMRCKITRAPRFPLWPKWSARFAQPCGGCDEYLGEEK